MKRTAFIMMALLAMTASAEQVTVCGPDGKLQVTVDDHEGRPTYAVAYEGTAFLNPSPIGLNTNVGDFTQGLRLAKASQAEALQQQYSVATIKRNPVEYKATRQVLTFDKDGKPAFDLELQVSNHDVAFRYRVYPQGERLCCVVNAEATAFVLPQGSTTFLCPQAKPMTGFARTAPSYETSYTVDDALGKNGWGEGYTFPCLFRNADKGWVLISETGVTSAYCASRLLGKAGGTYVLAFPQEGEYNGNGTVAPGIILPGYTPWRTVTVGTTLAPVVETTVAYDVVEPLYEASTDYARLSGRGTWSWIIADDASCNYDEQKRYIDFAADMGYESVLIDAQWDRQIGYGKMAELAAYGKAKGVGIYLWYNSNGYWNDAPQTPRGIMHNTILRHREMKWMQQAGIRGIKVDFVGSDKQAAMQLYEDILTDANEHGLMVIFHGCTLPRGWERMYPNFMASEAVLASENLRFSQGSCDKEAFNACLNPFIRNTVATMDFGGSALNKFYHKDNNGRGTHRVTSDVYALATAVLFHSPVQHFALAPNNMTDAPAWAIDFMKQVPTLWQDVRYIDGYPGRYVVLARKSAGKWYVAGVNATGETLKLKLPLDMLEAGAKLTCYTDNDKLEGSVATQTLKKNRTLAVNIPTNGAVLLVEQ